MFIPGTGTLVSEGDIFARHSPAPINNIQSLEPHRLRATPLTRILINHHRFPGLQTPTEDAR